jgi:hypothetical protein
MNKPFIRIHNTETDEVIDREMTDEEFEQTKKDDAEIFARNEAIINAANIKASAESKLAALGLTPDEIKSIVGGN